MHRIEPLLAQHFPDRRWHITPPPAGVQKESYVAESERRKLFVKFDAATSAWQRLAEIGAAPPLLVAGTYRGRPYTIHAFVDGVYPDRTWFRSHLALLATCIRSYHYDQQLTQILSVPFTLSFPQHLTQEISALQAARATATLDVFNTGQFGHAFKLFCAQALQLQPVPLVPTHADPSPVNMLVTTNSMVLIDWDDVLLSDPMRDVGLIMWWYVPQNLWPVFFDRYGAAIDRDRIFWWIAKRSLELALWFDARQANEPAHTFVLDFYRAVRHAANPQADE